MHRIHKDFRFRAAHYLGHGYQGKCKNLHGEYYKVEVWIESEELDEFGMVVDFGEIKSLIHDRFDHRCINDIPPFDEVNPTAENMAAAFFTYFMDLCQEKENHPIVLQVRVYESDTSYAEYSPWRSRNEQDFDQVDTCGDVVVEEDVSSI